MIKTVRNRREGSPFKFGTGEVDLDDPAGIVQSFDPDAGVMLPIAVALLGRNHPVGVILSALLFAVLQHGGIYVDGFSEHVTKDIVQVLQGIIILFVAAEAFFRGPVGRFSLLKRSKI